MSDKAELRSKLRHIAEELEKDLKRVEVKGRTLCLKIKLHTYEVFTRQMSPPKAVDRVDDLYNYALPMLAKLEKEIPDMKLRLMGLRCTHLISTKRADVDNFFAKRANAVPGVLQNNADMWEVWPDSEFEKAARAERQAKFEELERLSQEHGQEENGQLHGFEDFPFPGTEVPVIHRMPVQDFSTADWHEPFGRYKYGSAPNTPDKPPLIKLDSKGESWECPICATAQAANDRDFNEHIDLCLSRGTIRNAVAESAAVTDSKDNTPTRPGSAAGVKRKGGAAGQSGNEGEAKQRKLFFA
jgi:DNA polymerase kappa